ncbi:MAG TPA: DUF169 domain-containing protein [Desulfobacteraceae bacterium]|nr:DUF169 domain-containing protein [Desulfobacteraceae bacterium]HPJ67649.1 DUF169 domain-containing protein [Desulfobacteraceae bacterium]HPQ29373.1 DUF169 domain-containing protein [Desulfobacteraceae bacterium]
MDLTIKRSFTDKWKKYFAGSELPIACFYSDDLDGAEFPDAPKPNKHGLTCLFSQLAPVRIGKASAFNQDNLGCWGAKGLLGFIPAGADEQTVNFMVNIERYKKGPDHVRAMFENSPPLKAEKKYLIFKRWDSLSENDDPQVVFFFCTPDTLSGLHGLANYDTMTPHGVITPFCSGCEMLIAFPMKELKSEDPKAVIGLLDPSARVCVKPNHLSFSIPWPKLLSMHANMDDCFLNTYVWEKLHNRLDQLEK